MFEKAKFQISNCNLDFRKAFHWRILLDESCSYDGWDCCQTDYPDWIGDGICDSIHNNAECNFDGTDCASYAIIDDSALAETCKPEHDYMLNWIGDTICDVVLNTEECDFDGGDCNGESPDYPVYLGWFLFKCVLFFIQGPKTINQSWNFSNDLISSRNL